MKIVFGCCRSAVFSKFLLFSFILFFLLFPIILFEVVNKNSKIGDVRSKAAPYDIGSSCSACQTGGSCGPDGKGKIVCATNGTFACLAAACDVPGDRNYQTCSAAGPGCFRECTSVGCSTYGVWSSCSGVCVFPTPTPGCSKVYCQPGGIYKKTSICVNRRMCDVSYQAVEVCELQSSCATCGYETESVSGLCIMRTQKILGECTPVKRCPAAPPPPRPPSPTPPG